MHFVCVLKIWLFYDYAWKEKLQVDSSEGVINELSAAERKECSKVKVKQSRYRPGVAQIFPGSLFSKIT